jgi:hypothetical protein
MRIPFFLGLILPAVALSYNINYGVNLSQYKETRTLTNTLSFNQNISQRVTLNIDASFTANSSDDLKRFVDTRSGSARVSWRPIEDIEFATSLRRTINMEDRFGAMVQDKIDDTATGEIRYWPFEWLSMDLGLGIHIYDSEYASGDTTATLYDEGGVRNASISMNRNLFDLVSTSLAFSENRTYGDQTDTGGNDLTGRISYSFPRIFEGGYLSVQVTARKNFVSYADSLQTHREDMWTHSENFVLPDILPDISIEVGSSWNWTNRFWEDTGSGELLDDVRDRKDRDRTIHSGIRWNILENLDLDFSISRAIGRADRWRQGTGVDSLAGIYDVTDDRNLTATLSYTPGNSRISFTRVIELIRFDTHGVWFDSYGNEYEDNSDRDELREVLGMTVRIPLDSRMTLKGNLQGQRRETYYLMSEQSANSKTSSVYSFSPGFEYELGDRWNIDCSVKFSADYTTYLFPEAGTSGGNLLFRNVQSFFSLQKVATDSTQLGISHNFRYQDQGSYDNQVFARSEESLNNTISVFGGFHLSSDLGVTPSYSWEYTRREYPGSSMIAPRIEHLHHVGLRTSMNMSAGALLIQITRTFYSNESRPSYWRATIGFNYLL